LSHAGKVLDQRDIVIGQVVLGPDPESIRSWGVLNEPAVRMISRLAKAVLWSTQMSLKWVGIGITFTAIYYLNADGINTFEDNFSRGSVSLDNKVI
jgi:hypothetical protein